MKIHGVRAVTTRLPIRRATLLLPLLALLLASGSPAAAAPPNARPTPRAAANTTRTDEASAPEGATPTPFPEAAAELPEQVKVTTVTSPAGMVVSGSKEASRIGAEVLASGGNAVDAAVAAAFALGVTEPTLCGLGGQTYMLIHLQDGRDVAIDGSVVVPMQASVDELKRLDEAQDRSGYDLVAAPGTLAALTHALQRFGTRNLAEELAPAIDLARFGVVLGETERAVLKRFWKRVWDQDSVLDLFYRDSSEVWETGHHYCQPALANTMLRIAERGAGEFYRGGIADRMAADVTRKGGSLRKADLVNVRAIEKQPCRGTYRGHEVVSFPSPGGGAILLEALHIVESFPQDLLRGDSTDRLELLVEAVRIAELDYRAGRLPPDLLDRTLTTPQHGRARASLIRFDRILRSREIVSKVPPLWQERGTTQLTVADSAGNVVSLTQTLGGPLGAGVATSSLGFVYNNLLRNFQFTDPSSQGFLRPRERPLTTMTPTIVLQDGKPWLALGSAGSGRIVSAVLLGISNVIDRGLPLPRALEVPRILWEGGSKREVYLEMFAPVTNAQADELERRGYTHMKRLYFPAELIDLVYYGSINAIEVDDRDGTIVGVADPHRYGVAVGVPVTGR